MDSDLQRDEALKQEKLRVQQFHADLKWLMENAAGRRILKHFFVAAEQMPFSATPEKTAYNLGAFEFVRGFLQSLRRADAALYYTAASEALPKG